MGTNANFRELMQRSNGGLDIRLRWHPETDSLSLHIADDQTGEEHECPVPRGDALDAFEHPFVYLVRGA
jgi:hypothetical protein